MASSWFPFFLVPCRLERALGAEGKKLGYRRKIKEHCDAKFDLLLPVI
jgi:hypothetical protein